MKLSQTDPSETCFRRLYLDLLIVFIFFTFCVALPGTAVSSAMDTLAKQTDKQLRQAERMMHSGKSEEALTIITLAEAGIAQIKAAEPNNSRLKSLESKYGRTKKALDRKLGQSGQTTAAKATTPPKATKSSQSDKLPGGVSKRLRDINKALDESERALAKQRIDNANYKLSGAKDLFAEIDQQYGGKFSPTHPDYKAVAERYTAVEASIAQGAGAKAAAEAGAAQAGAAAKARADKWVQKFSPYITGSYFPAGHKPSKRLLFPGTSQPKEFAAMDKIYNELKTLYNEFLQAGFPKENPWPLDMAVNDVKYALENYEGSMKSGKQSLSQGAGSNLDQALTYLNKDAKWKSDSNALPPLVDKDWMTRINDMVKQAAQGYGAGDPALVALQKKHKQLIAQDQKHRKMRTERRRMRTEAYTGKDLKEIRKQAEKVIDKEKNGAKVLRISVYSNSWKEERVLEHTDTTQTAVRYRVTQMINAQVAAKQGGKVELHTLHIAKDKQSSGWSTLYGHIMYSDPMLEKNVNKKVH